MRLSVIRARWFWLFLIALPLAAFGSYPGQSLSTDGDNLLHLYRLVALHKNVAEGNYLPRWSAELFLGFGYPLHNFYASLTYYLAEALHLLGLSYEHALIYAMLVLLFVASLGIYRLASDFFAGLGVVRPAPALLATAAYLFAPYLLFNVYVRGAIAEVGAQALLPWLLWSFRRLLCAAQPARYLPSTIFILVALALTHTVSLFLTPPILIVYAFVLLWRVRTEPQELKRRLFWFGMAILSAAVLSAFFWLPALLERQFLTTQAQEAARQLLSQHTWNWRTFLDADWQVRYNDPAVTSLRRVQLLLAIVGALACRRWNGEWLFWVGLALAACLLIGEGATGFWTSHPLLLTIQFPWQLLGIASLPLALLTGGILSRGWFEHGRGRTVQFAGLALLTLAIVYVHYPRMAWLGWLEVEPEQVNLTSISQYEAITGRYGLSTATFREFTPRWVQEFNLKSLPPTGTEGALDITLEDASSQSLEMRVAAAQPERLLFSNFYFPGWHVRLDDDRTLVPYPISDVGLLAVDVPEGEHRLLVNWGETPPRLWGDAFSVLSLLLLGFYCRGHPDLRRAAIYCFLPLIVAASLMVAAPSYAPPYHQTPDQPIEYGVRLLGYTTYQEEREALYIFPYWYVAHEPADLVMHWQLLDEAGHVVATMRSFPYFNTLRAFQWSVNMLVDDGYYFPLPPGLDAGVYSLALAVAPSGAEMAGMQITPRVVGQVEIAYDVPPLPEINHQVDVRFQEPNGRNQITLRGYQVTHEASGTAEAQAHSAAVELIASPGDTIRFTLAWQSQLAVPTGVQVFNQLLDYKRQVLVQVNEPLQLSEGAPYYLWNPYWVKEKSYQLQIPEDAVGGLYSPYIGIYQLDTQERYPVHDVSGAEIGDALLLPPVKVVQREAAPLANWASVRFGSAIRLEGYELEVPASGLQPQSTMTLTVQYKSLVAPTVDYTQFVHLNNPELGMAAQVDAAPHGNPTSSWVPGEYIVDKIPLTIAADAKPGAYTLALGLYDPLAGGQRLPALGPDNQPLPGNQLIIAEVEIR